MPVASRPLILACALAAVAGLVGASGMVRGPAARLPVLPVLVAHRNVHPPAEIRAADATPPAADMGAGSTVYSIAMHMHGSISEGNAGMAWHAEQALTHNVDVVWWTDHDGARRGSSTSPRGCITRRCSATSPWISGCVRSPPIRTGSYAWSCR